MSNTITIYLVAIENRSLHSCLLKLTIYLQIGYKLLLCHLALSLGVKKNICAVSFFSAGLTVMLVIHCSYRYGNFNIVCLLTYLGVVVYVLPSKKLISIKEHYLETINLVI